MWCFQRDLPEGLKDAPVIGRYGKLIGWLALTSIAVWYVRPNAWGGYDEGVGFFLVGIILLGFAAAAIITCFMWSGDKSSRLYALSRFVDVYPTITKPYPRCMGKSKSKGLFLCWCVFVLVFFFSCISFFLYKECYTISLLAWCFWYSLPFYCGDFQKPINWFSFCLGLRHWFCWV